MGSGDTVGIYLPVPLCCAVFHNAVSYAVELRLLDANPVDRIQWKAPAVAQTVDRRVVAGPALVAGLLAAVSGHSDRGEHPDDGCPLKRVRPTCRRPAVDPALRRGLERAVKDPCNQRIR